MNDEQKLAGFRALVKDHQNSGHYFEGVDGNFRPWPELSAQSKLHYVAGDAALYDLPFKQFAEAARDLLPPPALAEASCGWCCITSVRYASSGRYFRTTGGPNLRRWWSD